MSWIAGKTNLEDSKTHNKKLLPIGAEVVVIGLVVVGINVAFGGNVLQGNFFKKRTSSMAI